MCVRRVIFGLLLTHIRYFGHDKIRGYTNRPFYSAYEMDETLIHKWNRRVSKDDTVYHLGDFALANIREVKAYRERLNGRIVLIKGNHDRFNSSRLKLQGGFDEAINSLSLTISGVRYFLKHKPVLTPDMPEFDVFLCGHIHTLWAKNTFGGKLFINVGVDVWNFEPKTIEELLQR